MLPNSHQQLAIGIARLRQQEDQEREQQRETQAREAARIAAEAVANTPEALFARRTAEINEAIAKQQAQERANFDKVEREKQEHIADIKLLGAVVASELKPVLADLVTEIRALVAQLKDGQQKEN